VLIVKGVNFRVRVDVFIDAGKSSLSWDSCKYMVLERSYRDEFFIYICLCGVLTHALKEGSGTGVL